MSSEREAAASVVDQLRKAGHEAYFVGGCVRDELLGREPREYDVATSADPDSVEALFPRTYAVGKRFGVVIALVGDHSVEVATFRSDDAYVDGRRPTGVRFTTAREDAERRDFTLNALFLDPTSGEILDFVGGRADLDARLLRAIGKPRERFREDKLRLLRAVRFATTGPFDIEADTWAAVCEMAPEIGVVSWERVRQELSRILVSGRSVHGARMLLQSGLMDAILPEITAMDGVEQPPQYHPEGDVLTHTLLGLDHFDQLEERPLTLGLGVLLHDVGKPPTFRVADRIRFDGHDRVGAEMAREIMMRLRYSKAEIEEVVELVAQHMAFPQIREWREAKLRRFLTGPHAEHQLALHRLDRLSGNGDLGTWQWCTAVRRGFLAERPPPPRTVTGNDLLAAGYPKGPMIGKVLAAMDDERLEGRRRSKEEALAWALSTFPPPTGPSS